MSRPFEDVDRESDLIHIDILESTFEAQLVDSILDERGIPHLIRSYHDTAYDGLFQFQKGWGEVRAPSGYKNQIIDILKGIRTGSGGSSANGDTNP